MKALFFLLVVLLPTQLGRHFWPDWAFIQGIRVDYLSPTIYLTDVIAIWLIAAWLITKFSIFRRYWKLVVLVFIGSIGIYFSNSPPAGIYGLARLVEFVLLGIITSQIVKDKKDLLIVVNLLTIGVVFEATLAIAQFMKQGSMGGIFWFLGERTFTGITPGAANAVINGELILRPYGTFSHPNVLSGFIVVAMTLVISNLKKLILYISMGFGTLALILTMSRAAIFLWLIILAGVVLKNLRMPIKIRFSILALVFLVLIYGLFFGGRTFSINDQSLTRRYELNMAAIEMFKSSPLMGVGLNNFLVNLPSFQQTKSTILYLQPVHNIFLLIVAETGLLGLTIFIWLIWKTIKKLLTAKRFLLTTLLAILFLGLFDHYWLTLEQGQLLFTLILGLSWAKIKT